MLPGALAGGARARRVRGDHHPARAEPDRRGARRQRARRSCARCSPAPRDTLLIEDDHLGPVAGSELHTLAAGRERWAATRSVAKALGPDLRLAVLAGDAQTVARVQGRQQCGPGWVSHILQALVLELWREPRGRRADRARRARPTPSAARACSARLRAARACAAHGASGLNVWVPVADEAGVVGRAAAARLGGRARRALPARRRHRPAVRVTTATLTERRGRALWPRTSPRCSRPCAWARSG